LVPQANKIKANSGQKNPGNQKENQKEKTREKKTEKKTMEREGKKKANAHIIQRQRV